MRTIARLVLVCALGVNGGCGLIGPSCVDRQRRGTVSVTSGEVEAGRIGVHLMPYDLQGSQNDIQISWTSTDQTRPRLEAYATRASCAGFALPAFENAGDCRVLAGAAPQPDGRTASLIITHGRGNPEILGSPAEYRLWIVGDPIQATTYTITATWFRGPDC